jgi:predicted RNA polymerase sigma factor
MPVIDGVDVRGDELALLDDQDRSLWDEAQVVEARRLLERALALQGAGAYVVQAAIADLHVQEPRDWDQIALLYRRLEELTGSPIVTVNRAVALAARTHRTRAARRRRAQRGSVRAARPYPGGRLCLRTWNCATRPLVDGNSRGVKRK